MIAGADGGDRRRLVLRPPGTQFQAFLGGGASSPGPAWSPDGRRIAAVARRPQDAGAALQDVVIADSQSGDHDVLPLSVTGTGSLAWLDDRTLLLNQDDQLWRLSYPDERLSRFTNDLLEYRGLSQTADRRTLAVTRSEQRDGQHSLSHGHGREDVVHQMGGALRHATAAARRADHTALAREGDQPIQPTALTPEARESAGEPATRQEPAELLVDDRGSPAPSRQESAVVRNVS